MALPSTTDFFPITHQHMSKYGQQIGHTLKNSIIQTTKAPLSVNKLLLAFLLFYAILTTRVRKRKILNTAAKFAHFPISHYFISLSELP